LPESVQGFDEIIVRGNPVCVCGTFSFADGTIEAGWTPEAEAAYIAADEEA
jgi:hypothetical protein